MGCAEGWKMLQGWRNWSKANWLGENFREDVFQYTSLLDCSASHWRQLDPGQTQPETRRTSGDVLQWGRMECEGQEPDQSKKKSNNERGDPSTAGNENEVNADCLAGATGTWTQLQCNGRNMNADQEGNGPLNGGGGYECGKRE